MLISLAGVVAPFLLGAALASFLYADGRFFTPNVSSWQSMMYLGAAMSVTAFPVLARIIQERGIGGTALGTLALAAGAADDVIAWSPARRRAASSASDSRASAIVAISSALACAVVRWAVRRPARLTAAMAGAVHRDGTLRAFVMDIEPRCVQDCVLRAACFSPTPGLSHAPQPALVGRAAVACRSS